MPLRYNVNGDYAVFTRMKEKGISLAAFATTILFLVLTVIMVSVTLQSAYAWLVMGSTLFLFLTLCSYSSCEKTHGSRWRRASINSDSISTISESRDMTVGDFNRSILPYWITDLPPSYAAATSRPSTTQDATIPVSTTRINPYPPPPPYSSVVDLPTEENARPPAQTASVQVQTVSSPSLIAQRTSGPPERVHSLRIKSGTVRVTNCDTRSLDGRLSNQGHSNPTFSDNSSMC